MQSHTYTYGENRKHDKNYSLIKSLLGASVHHECFFQTRSGKRKHFFPSSCLYKNKRRFFSKEKKSTQVKLTQWNLYTRHTNSSAYLLKNTISLLSNCLCQGEDGSFLRVILITTASHLCISVPPTVKRVLGDSSYTVFPCFALLPWRKHRKEWDFAWTFGWPLCWRQENILKPTEIPALSPQLLLPSDTRIHTLVSSLMTQIPGTVLARDSYGSKFPGSGGQ